MNEEQSKKKRRKNSSEATSNKNSFFKMAKETTKTLATVALDVTSAVTSGTVSTVRTTSSYAARGIAYVGEEERKQQRQKQIDDVYNNDSEKFDNAIAKITSIDIEDFNDLYNLYANSFVRTRAYASLNSATSDLVKDVQENCSNSEEVAARLRNYLAAKQNHGLGFCHFLIMEHFDKLQNYRSNNNIKK